MNYRNIFWGVILILVGVLFTLENLNIIYFNVRELWRLWPAVLILWGVSILPVDKWIRLALVLLVLGGCVFFMLDRTVYWENEEPVHLEWPGEEERSEYTYQNFDIDYNDSTTLATLNMEAAAGSFSLSDTTEKLLSYSQSETGIQYKYYVSTTDDRVKVNIEPSDDGVVLNKNTDGRIQLRLNENPLWNINLEVGAAAVDFNLVPFKIKKLDLESGAASLKVKLGDKYPETHVNIDAGASEIVLHIPEESGCDLELSSVLSGKNLDGFDKVDHGHYQTANFNTAANKVYLEVNAAISSYTIIRY